MAKTLKHGDFAENQHTKFKVVEANEPLELELIEVSQLNDKGNQERFSLIFSGDKDKFLPQQLYELEHEKLGKSAIFLVPVGVDDNNAKYEAVFNNLKDG